MGSLLRVEVLYEPLKELAAKVPHRRARAAASVLQPRAGSRGRDRERSIRPGWSRTAPR